LEKSISYEAQQSVISLLNSDFWTGNSLHSTKLLIYRSTVKSILTYGAETWPMKRKYRHKLSATEMDYLRHLERIS
jgi:hypothetical protein